MKLAIFDMDGLMFDTGRLAYRVYLEASKQLDFELTPDVYYYLTGRNEVGIRQGLVDLYGIEAPTNELRDLVHDIRSQVLMVEKRVYKKKGLLEILNFLKEKDISIALASSSKRETIDKYLEMESMPELFDVIIAGDEVEVGKPNPEIFLKACQKLKISPGEAIVFEDSLAGIEAANLGGMTSILIPDDIRDLDSIKGKYKIKMALPVEKTTTYAPTHVFNNLLEAKEFLSNRK